MLGCLNESATFSIAMNSVRWERDSRAVPGVLTEPIVAVRLTKSHYQRCHCTEPFALCPYTPCAMHAASFFAGLFSLALAIVLTER